mmetsp:Transcript_19160/g.53649  ORF Transcript_19160/g.53649 Transcript_19160/m.53649 type:complete len:674 (-) Transcript_19160:217-2238(-)
MGDFHYIVDKLNQPPFNCNLSLLSFSEETPQQLLQLVSDVFTQISPKHQKVDVSREDPDAMVDRLTNFLKIIKYKPNYDPVAFRQLLAAGDKDVIYPILKWVVPQPQLLEKRAFVGHYLSFPDMPDELNYDPDVSQLKEEIKGLQEAFIETHKSNEAVQAINKDKQALKARIKGLEEEKERLVEKVERAKAQVDRVADKNSYLEVCISLRKEQDEEVALSNQMQTQRQLLEKAEAHYNKVNARLKELSANYQEGSATKLMESLSEDVNSLRFQVNERYPKELERRQKRVDALQKAFTSGGNTDIDLQRLQAEADGLHMDIREMTERRAKEDKARQGDKTYQQLRQAQQMAAMVARKKDDINAKLDRLQEKKANLVSQLEKLEASDGSGEAMVSEEEWRAKYESMKAALPTYKKMKKELGDVEAEVFVLAYTEEVLASEEERLLRALKSVEKKQGVAGFSDVVSGIEKVSEQKSAVDEIKGMTLAEISSTVEHINKSINDRKAKLAPDIKSLRQMRQQFAELEASYTSAKNEHDAALAKYEAPVATIEATVTGLRKEVMENESKFHLLHCQLAAIDQQIKKVSSGPVAERLKERYELQIKSAEAQSKEAQTKQRKLKDTHSTGLNQIDVMNDLVQLLQIKLGLGSGLGDQQAGEFGQPQNQQYSETATGNVFVL